IFRAVPQDRDRQMDRRHEGERRIAGLTALSRRKSFGQKAIGARHLRAPILFVRLLLFARNFPARLGALQALVAFAVIAAALLDPLQPAIAVADLVGLVVIEAGFHAGFARGVL